MIDKFESDYKKKKANPLVFIVTSFTLTFFLFFIDEGNYSFDWIGSLYSMIVAFIYALPMFLIQLLIFKSLSKKISLKEKYWLSIPFGLITGTMLVVFVFNLLK